MGNCVQSIQKKIADREKEAQQRTEAQIETRLSASQEEIEALIGRLDLELDELGLQTAKVDNEITYITEADDVAVERRKRALYKRLARKAALEADEAHQRQAFNRALQKRVKFNRMERTLMELRSDRRIGSQVAAISEAVDIGLEDLDNSAEVHDRINELASVLEEATRTSPGAADEIKDPSDDLITKQVDALMEKRKHQAASAKPAPVEPSVFKPKAATATAKTIDVQKSDSSRRYGPTTITTTPARGHAKLTHSSEYA